MLIIFLLQSVTGSGASSQLMVSSNKLAPPGVSEIFTEEDGASNSNGTLNRRTFLHMAAGIALLGLSTSSNAPNNREYIKFIGGTLEQRQIAMQILHEIPLDILTGLRSISFDNNLSDGGQYYESNKRCIISGKYHDQESIRGTLLHELGHHYYFTTLARRVKKGMAKKHKNNRSDFGLISNYAQFENPDIIKSKENIYGGKNRDFVNEGGEALAEIFRVWFEDPELLFFHLAVNASEGLKYFIEHVAKAFTFKKSGSKYIRFYLSNHENMNFVDVKVPQKDLTYKDMQKLFFKFYPYKKDIKISLVNSIANNTLSFLYGTNNIKDKDVFGVELGRNKVYASIDDIHPYVRGVVSDQTFKNQSDLNFNEIMLRVRGNVLSFFEYSNLREDIKTEYLKYFEEWDKFRAEMDFNSDLSFAFETEAKVDLFTRNKKLRVNFIRKLLIQSGMLDELRKHIPTPSNVILKYEKSLQQSL